MLFFCGFAGLLVCWFAGLLVCWFAGLLVCLFGNLPCVYGFLSLKYSFAASLNLSRHFLFLLLRVGLGLLILSPAQNLLAIDNLADFSWRIAEIKWLSLYLLSKFTFQQILSDICSKLA